MTYYKLLIINRMGTILLNLSTQMVVEPSIKGLSSSDKPL